MVCFCEYCGKDLSPEDVERRQVFGDWYCEDCPTIMRAAGFYLEADNICYVDA